ncbi:MAG: 4,5-DOPA dioxygenase extradiol [Acidobacteria bacterium]|nr:4,5-DOPA dioxygenase extradiol [Acidobacteriota bacterium]
MNDPKQPKRMPVMFVGHGSPMNALEDNPWSRGFTALSSHMGEPNAILAISAHWYVDGTRVTAQPNPRTIHDFGGFPPALYEVSYPAPGHPELASRVETLLGASTVDLDTDWGLDHGTWSVLRWISPNARIPTIQLSIDRRLSARQHFELAQKLADLREEGVLILASGNIVHNLGDAFHRMRTQSHETPDWAVSFDASVKEMLMQRDTDSLLAALDSEVGRLAHPTPEHWLPLIYAYGVSDPRDTTVFFSEGFDWGSISMRNVVFG